MKLVPLGEQGVVCEGDVCEIPASAAPAPPADAAAQQPNGNPGR